jgi:hypothetical protein
MRREGNTTLNYATARSVAESFCSGGIGFGAGG